MSALGPISAVTIAAPELQHMIDSYQLYLGYELVEHGKVTPQLAALWNRPGLAGRRFALMLPEGEGRTFLRFVESKPAAGYQPFRHMGWNAAEIMVQDTDAVAARLVESPFRIIGPPADLSFSDKIRAMQALGPAHEGIYLTSFKEKIPEFDVPEADRFVDRVFIVILGGAAISGMNEFYRRQFAAPVAPVMTAVISVISQAHGLPPDSKHSLAAIQLAGQCYIEADEMPAGTLPRVAEGDELPAAISMVSFEVAQLPDGELPFLAPAQVLPHAPYYGRKAAVCTGAAGELIELIES